MAQDWAGVRRLEDALPTPESTARLHSIQAAALLTIAVTTLYLGWRLFYTVNPTALWLSLMLLALDVHAGRLEPVCAGRAGSTPRQ